MRFAGNEARHQTVQPKPRTSMKQHSVKLCGACLLYTEFLFPGACPPSPHSRTKDGLFKIPVKKWGGVQTEMRSAGNEARLVSKYRPNAPILVLTPNQVDLTESVYQVVLQKSIPVKNRQLILCISNNEG